MGEVGGATKSGFNNEHKEGQGPFVGVGKGQTCQNKNAATIWKKMDKGEWTG